MSDRERNIVMERTSIDESTTLNLLRMVWYGMVWDHMQRARSYSIKYKPYLHLTSASLFDNESIAPTVDDNAS